MRTLPEGIRPDQSARYNIPATHRNASPDCPVEHPSVGDEAYENAPSLATSKKAAGAVARHRLTRGN